MSDTESTNTTVNIEKEPTDSQLDDLNEHFELNKTSIVSRLVKTAHTRMLEQDMTRNELKKFILRERFAMSDDLIETRVDENPTEESENA